MGITTGSKLDKIEIRDYYTIKPSQLNVGSADSLHLPLVTPPSDEYRCKRIVTEDELMFIQQAVDKTGIKPYKWSLLKDNHTAIERSQKHLIDLIRYYEGDSEHYYESISVAYKDKGGNKTVGFGEWLRNSKTATTTQAKAYERLSEHIEEHAKYIRRKVGKKAYNDMPQSIKEALIDLSFNKGPDKIGKIIKSAIAKKDWSEVIANIHCVNLKGQTAEDPGLYRRSLSRAILAVRDLSGEERKEADAAIKNLYNKAVKCFDANGIDKKELNKIYEQYTTGKISGEAKSSESSKILVDDSFASKGVFAVAKKAYDGIADKQGVDFKTFYEEFKRINNNPESIVLGSELNVPYIKNIKAVQINDVSEINSDSMNTNTDSISITKVESDTLSSDVVKNDKNRVDNTDKEVKEPSFFSKALMGLKNLLKSVGNFFKNLFGFNEENDNKDPFADDEIVTFQKMVEKGNITKEGMFYLISADYEIKKGNTLWSLARRYETTPERICNDNNIADMNLIKAGETINIEKLGYKVEKGDNLYQISKKLGLTVEILKDLNNIEDINRISEGQMLEIPGFLYEVKSSDTLTKISKSVGVCVEDLKKINNLESDLIHMGQKIVVIYNNSDYTVSEDKKQVIVDEKTNTKTETINMSSEAKLAKRPLLQKKMKVNGKVIATREVYDPQKDEKYKYKEGKLSGKTIIINAGHGYSQAGTDIGTPGLKGLDDEWLLNYDNAMKLKDKLYEQGAKVIFLQGKARLIAEEVRKSNNKADMFISVHVNSAPNTKDRTQIYYRETGVSGEPKKNSIKLAHIMEKNFDKWIPKNENISSSDVFKFQGKQDYAQSSVNDERTGLLKSPLNCQKIPGVLWEVAFMTTPKGRERLANPKLMSNYADVMAQSVIEYFN